MKKVSTSLSHSLLDTARSILDGHIMLNCKLAHKNHYPAIDVMQSISRVMSAIVDDEQIGRAHV